MGDRLSAHIRSLQAVKWDIPKEGGGVNDYMELLVKETVTLHKVLSRYLSVTVVEVRTSIDYNLMLYETNSFWVVCNDPGVRGDQSSTIRGVR
jgi:hypothetical protein